MVFIFVLVFATQRSRTLNIHGPLKMQPKSEIGDVSVVLLGNFNPVIFSPSWFEQYDILTKEDTKKTQVKIIHPEITEFQNEWLKLQVQHNRFYAKISELPHIKVYDFVVKTFRENLKHTPLNNLGINRRVHFSAGSKTDQDRIGRLLAPREPWGKWGELIDRGDDEKHGGMTSLTMQIRDLDDRQKGFINITIQPSPLVNLGDAGIFMDVNDHYELTDPEEGLGSDRIIDLFENRFEASIRRSEEIIDQIKGLV